MSIVNRFVQGVAGIWLLIGIGNLIGGSGWTGHLSGAAMLVALAMVGFAWNRLAYWLGTTKEEREWSTVDSKAFKLHKAGKLAEAEPLYVRARDIADASGRPLLIANSMNNIAGLYLDQERWADAEPLLRRALELREAHLGPDNGVTLASVERLSGFLAQMLRWSEAEQLQQRALHSYQRTGNRRAEVETYIAIGVACRKQGKYGEAESSYAQAQRLIDSGKLKDEDVAGQLLADWAFLKVEQGKLDEAEPMYLKALKLMSPLGESTAVVLDNLANLYTKTGRPKEAAEISVKQLVLMRMELRSKLGQADHVALIPLLDQHARRLDAAGRRADAASARAQAVAIRQSHPEDARKVDQIMASTTL